MAKREGGIGVHCMITHKETTLALLKSIRDNGPGWPCSGICWNVGKASNCSAEGMFMPGSPYQITAGLARAWPEGNNTLWPIAGEDEPLGDPDYNAWDVNTEAGARRHRLLAWMIARLEGELCHG